MIKQLLAASLLLLLCPLVALASPPAGWTVNAAKSELTFNVIVNGQTVKGRFPGFGANIKFDPANLAQSSVKIIMDASGIKTGDTTRDIMLLKPAWFNVLDFPQAVFQSVQFKSSGPGKFLCLGKLTIKGTTRDISVPFTFHEIAKKASVTGSAVIERLQFKIGEGEDYETGSPVALSVNVNFKIEATRKN